METNIIKGFEQQDRINILRQILVHLREAHILIDNEDLRYDEHPSYDEKLIDAYDKISQSVFHTSDAITDWQSFLADVMAVVLNTDMENEEQLLMLGSLSNLRSIIGKLKSHGK